MAKSSTVQRLRRASPRGKKPTTKAGEFVREAGQKLKRAGRKVRARTKQGARGAKKAVASERPLGRKRSAARLTDTRRRW